MFHKQTDHPTNSTKASQSMSRRIRYLQAIRDSAPYLFATVALLALLMFSAVSPAGAQMLDENKKEPPKDGGQIGQVQEEKDAERQAIEENGAFNKIIELLAPIVVILGAIGCLIGASIKATAASDTNQHALSHKVMIGSLGASAVGMLYKDIYNLMVGWM